MRQISLTARLSAEEVSATEVEIALFKIEHASLDAPLRISTDPTSRLSAEPLRYGTRSSWGDADPANEPYLFLPIAVELPGDQEDVPAASTLVIDNLVAGLPKILRGLTSPASVSVAVVLASSPDVVEVEYTGLQLVTAGGDASQTRLELSRRPIEEENVPMDRFTRDRFPGLF
ncbi:hypothetical protein ACXN5S_12585 [Pseudoroseicyclus sp. H15]